MVLPNPPLPNCSCPQEGRCPHAWASPGISLCWQACSSSASTDTNPSTFQLLLLSLHHPCHHPGNAPTLPDVSPALSSCRAQCTSRAHAPRRVSGERVSSSLYTITPSEDRPRQNHACRMKEGRIKALAVSHFSVSEPIFTHLLSKRIYT